jgi:carbamoyl-phosphate synthase small subunit
MPGQDPAARFGTAFGPAEITHVNLNDGVIEGFRAPKVNAFSVQYHPEAAPGPHDARYLFGEFEQLMRQYSVRAGAR